MLSKASGRPFIIHIKRTLLGAAIMLLRTGETMAITETPQMSTGIDWPNFIVPQGKTSWEFRGKEFTVFEMDGIKFGVSICWESLFPHLFRQFVKMGAGFMINISSEAWFGVSDFQYQFLAATQFRAVENRTSIARAGNYTVSCFIDPYGRIVESFPENMMDENSFGKGHLTHIVTTSSKRSFYTLYGDIFTVLVIAMTLLGIIFAFFKKPEIEIDLRPEDT